ncbi:hypothetical protein [Geoalkalibacter sp.]|uniref:hypothetical protein n=1 Tax=Geoalkalibacter sp. TaxID=3041440 RepID=UPI00272E2DCB|nr:hypothetical protein [Geoalkalibacter sp.]
MKATLFAAIAMLLSIASPAFAAVGPQEHSGILVWAFIGFFGLIVVAQLVPAALVLIGIARSFAVGHQQLN